MKSFAGVARFSDGLEYPVQLSSHDLARVSAQFSDSFLVLFRSDLQQGFHRSVQIQFQTRPFGSVQFRVPVRVLGFLSDLIALFSCIKVEREVFYIFLRIHLINFFGYSIVCGTVLV